MRKSETNNIHPSAIVEDGAKVESSVRIGPFCIIGADVSLQSNVCLHSHVVISGNTTVGEGTEVFPFASLGSQPQDLKYEGEASQLIIGRNNIIREHVTMNPGTSGGGMVTRIGDNGLFMVGAHVAHDCQVGDNVIMANNATLAGHVSVGSFAILGGLSAVHQFVRIGEHAIVGGMTGVEHDVIPYGSVKGERARLAGLNIIGMRRRGFSRQEVDELREGYKALFGNSDTFHDRLSNLISSAPKSRAVLEIIDFIIADSSRSICQPKDNK
ncbi:MAG: acyl-[acyl-carrier-protein]--UDP-N-acetylglucosamine O-acyltransferase [Rhodospirillaceae bacterium]|nr:acyl-[acyl-carrier-protein]--UDP-N-acetylglucosamine O-acyltransferase [Rhodospirillaceae bacterium]